MCDRRRHNPPSIVLALRLDYPVGRREVNKPDPKGMRSRLASKSFVPVITRFPSKPPQYNASRESPPYRPYPPFRVAKLLPCPVIFPGVDGDLQTQGSESPTDMTGMREAWWPA